MSLADFFLRDKDALGVITREAINNQYIISIESEDIRIKNNVGQRLN